MTQTNVRLNGSNSAPQRKAPNATDPRLPALYAAKDAAKAAAKGTSPTEGLWSRFYAIEAEIAQILWEPQQ